MYPLSKSVFRHALLLFAGMLLLNSIGAQAAPVQPDYSRIKAGTLFLFTQDEAVDALVTRSRIRMQIAGVVADVQMVQEFRNTTDQWINGEYVFPLPVDAAVRNMTILLGERRIEGRILEREEAVRQFSDARDQGKVAAVVRRQQSNLFRAAIANIAPGESVSVELNYYQTAKQTDDQFSLRLPTTLTPRYNPRYPDSDDSAMTNPPQRPAGGASQPVFELSARLHSAAQMPAVSSTSHSLAISGHGHTRQIALKQTQAPMDRDFVLSWARPASATPGSGLFLHRSESGQRYAMLTLEPPAGSAPPAALQRELILVIDTSGSMAGAPIRAAKRALARAVSELDSDTLLNIIRFDTQAQAMSPTAIAADAQGRARALTFIDALQADRGTEMSNALHMAFQGQQPDRLRQVIFLTDGSVSNERQLVRLIARLRGNARLFPVAIGQAPNRHFLSLAARSGRGLLTHIADEQQIAGQIEQLTRSLAVPVMSGISITDKDSGTALSDFALPDLYAGRSHTVFLRLPESTREIQVKGRLRDAPWSQTLRTDQALPAPAAISSLWADRQIKQLSQAQWLENTPDKYRRQITALSLEHEVLSPYTAFLAVEATPARDHDLPLRDHQVANLLPAGTDTRRAIAMPQTGLALPLRIISGLLLLAIAGVTLRYPWKRA
ncbi:marine proteobacterial sortase target protein [Granulosicoccaceae sp. 1_MG-2023]|nr:marine proteobacterial sortase target protein [Granulosicoccaceae sp. 1_MG-2023]